MIYLSAMAGGLLWIHPYWAYNPFYSFGQQTVVPYSKLIDPPAQQ